MLNEKINQFFKEAFKNKNEAEVATLRLLRSAIKNKEIEKRGKLAKTEKAEDLEKLSELSDEEIIAIVSSEIKKRREAIVDYQKGGRAEFAERENEEIEILKQFLPEQLSEKEARQKVKEIIARVGASGQADFGKVMGAAMAELKGRAAGDLVSKIVKEELKID